MADTFTPFLNLTKPDPNGLAEVSELNGDFDLIDSFASTTDSRVDVLEAHPIVKMLTAANQSIADATVTTVDFAGGTESYDTDNMGSIATDRLIIRTAGYYRFSLRASWASNATGYRALILQKAVGAGAGIIAQQYGAPAPATLTTFSFTSDLIPCAVNDEFEMRVIQSSGAALNIIQANGLWQMLAAEWVRSL
jgi:hypothetical protein